MCTGIATKFTWSVDHFDDITLLNQLRAGQRPVHDWFLEIAFFRDVCVLVCVCVSAPEAINK